MSGADDTPHYHGHRDRLRARFMEVGGDPLPDYELLELVLFRSIPRRDVKPIAKELLKRFGAFAEVLAASPARLMEVDGIGESVVTDLKIVEASARRLARGEVAKRPVLSSWNTVLDYCRTAMAFAEKEQFRELERSSTERHFARVREGRVASIETSGLHLDVVRDLKRIEAHLAATAHPLLERSGALKPTRLAS